MLYEISIDFEKNFKLSDIQNSHVNSTYDNKLVSFLSSLSKSILKDKSAREFPDLITFAYFCRKSNLHNFKCNFLSGSVSEKQSGLGICLHISPSNIPMNFAFSFVMGFLSGNKNIVRLPSKKFDQIELFLKHFDSITKLEQFSLFSNQNCFIRTERDSKKLIDLVGNVDCLVVWGGDSTVKKFRTFLKKNSCQEVYFPDRVSSALINCFDFIQLKEDDLAKLMLSFYNDTYLVDQNACSSASIIFWHGNDCEVREAKALFDESLSLLLNKQYELKTSSLIDKQTDILKFCHIQKSALSINFVNEKLWYLSECDQDLIKPKLGTFIDVQIDKVEDICNYFRPNEQTLTYFGYDAQSLVRSFKNISRVLPDRVVPIGSALDMGLIWDGKNMINLLSRYVNTI